MEYDVHVVRLPFHEVIDGVREAEDEVTDKHRQYGLRRLVHACGPLRVVLPGGQAALVSLDLKQKKL